MYTSSSVPSSYSNFLLSINSKIYIDNNYFKILQQGYQLVKHTIDMYLFQIAHPFSTIPVTLWPKLWMFNCHITTLYRARHSFYSSIVFKHNQQEVNRDE
jgi:hypothetical protein